jgi:hypothetical protein
MPRSGDDSGGTPVNDHASAASLFVQDEERQKMAGSANSRPSLQGLPQGPRSFPAGAVGRAVSVVHYVTNGEPGISDLRIRLGRPKDDSSSVAAVFTDERGLYGY